VSASDVSELVRPQSAPPSLCASETFKTNDTDYCDYQIRLLAEQLQNTSVRIQRPLPLRIPPVNTPHYHAINSTKKSTDILSLETTKPTTLTAPHLQEKDFFKKLKHASLQKRTTEKKNSKTNALPLHKTTTEQPHQRDYQREPRKPHLITIPSNASEITCCGVAVVLQKKNPILKKQTE